MAKTTVTTIVSDVKILGDYNIVDSDLDALLLKGINFAIKRMKQWFLDRGMYIDIGGSDTFPTTADQNYIDIATLTVDFDEHVILSERTNDKPIPIIPYAEFVAIYPDPTADKSNVPDAGAFFNNRLYLGPTPSTTGVVLYLEYVPLITKLIAGGTLPFTDKYDELVVAITMEYLIRFMDNSNRTAIRTAEENTDRIRRQLISNAATNIGQIQQRQSRRQETPYFSPRKVVS